MASIHYRDGGADGHEGDGPGALAPVSRWVNLAGAATSMALIAGLAVWGYKLAVRDVTGVPVIRAMEGPARIAPEDPGGDLARHVGLSVNAVAAHGLAAPAPDQVVLAPRDAGLSEDDPTMAALAPLERPDPQQPEAQPEELVTAAMPVPDAPEQQDAVTRALAEAMAADDGASSAAEPAAEEAVEIIPASVPGVVRSPRPLARPARDRAAEAAAEASAAAPAQTVDIDPASLAEGTRLAQLGAFDSPELARAEWDRVVTQFGSLMDGKQRVIQEANSGGRTFYRLRVHGFDDVAAARRFCAALVAEQANCIPAAVR
jgi:hypothetical protein